MTNKAPYKHRPHPIWATLPYVAILAFLGLIAGGYGLIRHFWYPEQWQNVDLISEPVSMQIFSENAEELSQAGVNNRLCVWVETSPSMAGFLRNRKQGDSYPQTFFEQLVSSPGNMIGDSITNTQITEYAFNPAFAARLQKAKTTDIDMLLKEQEIENPSSILTTDYFLADLDFEANALSAAFQLLDPSCPNIIITDFLESSTALSSLATLKASYQNAFKNDRTVDIIGIEDAFSGFLFDVDTSGKIYSFGAADKSGFSVRGDQVLYTSTQVETITATLLKLGSYNSGPRPRPLYIIVVGSSDQCDEFSATILQLYEQYRTNINSRFKSLSLHSKHTEDKELLPAARHFSLQRAGLNSVLYDMRGGGTVLKSDGSQPDAEECTFTAEAFDYEKQPLHAEGVDAFRFEKDPSLAEQVYTITYFIEPDVENYKNNYEKDIYSPGPLKARHLVFSPASSDSSSAFQVRTLGEQFLQYKAEPISLGRAVSLSRFEPSSRGITLELTLDLSELVTGYYRLDIPVQLLRTVDILDNTLDNAVFSVWYGDDFQSFTRNPFCTPRLMTQLQQLCQAQQACLNSEVLVADIKVDLEIVEKQP